MVRCFSISYLSLAQFVGAICDILTHTDQRTEAAQTCLGVIYLECGIESMQSSDSDSHSFSFLLLVCRECGRHKLLTELQTRTRAERGGVSRQGTSRQEEEG